VTENNDNLFERARAWIEADPDPETRAELAELIERQAIAEITGGFAAELAFGTAGLRGVVGPGPARMNRANVIRTTRAVAEQLLSCDPDAKSRPVVVGFDARLSSRRFAEDAAAVLRAAGLSVRMFVEPVPTPLVAYAARSLAASAAIVITASHNPRSDNGYKLYGGDAVQIVAPLDREIAERILRLPGAASIPRIAEAAPVEALGQYMTESYLADLVAQLPFGARFPGLKIVYSPLHGVGTRFAKRALELGGFQSVDVVAEQAEPDGNFPTTPFPNPEEPGVMDRAFELASRVQAELVLVNDPDADRLAVGVPSASGDFIQLSGNEIGLLLADYLLEHATRAPQPLVVSSLVSSPALDAVAAAHGAELERTNTGFKWIWTAARTLERTHGLRFAFGYEEALGYSVNRSVRDKDGISAAVCCAALAADSRARGEGVLDRLYALFRKYGLWVSAQHNVALEGVGGRAFSESVLDRLASSAPATIAGRRVEFKLDHRSPKADAPPWRAPTSMIELTLERAARVLVRPSGTEPKLKIYVDLEADLDSVTKTRGPIGPAKEQASREAAEIARELAAWITAA
jgi:phosphomannomutase